MQAPGAVFPFRAGRAGGAGASITRLQAVEGTPTTALESVGLRCLEASLRLGHVAPGQSAHVHVLGRSVGDYQRLQTQPVFLLHLEPGHRCKFVASVAAPWPMLPWITR